MDWISLLSRRPRLQDCLEEVLSVSPPRGRPDLAIVFATSAFRDDFALIGQVQDRLGAPVMIGCSADGVIGAGLEIEGGPALSLNLGWLPGAEVRSFRVADGSNLPGPDDPPEAWQDMIGFDRSASQILLVDPFSDFISHLLSGLDFAFPRAVRIGGLASGARQPDEVALFLDGDICRNGAIGVSLSGLSINSLVAQGCRPVGAPMVITGCQDTNVYELDHRPALQLLASTVAALSPDDRLLARHSLFVGLATESLSSITPEDFLIRNILGVHAPSESIGIAAPTRRGQILQFHLRDARASTLDLERAFSGLQPESLSQARGALLFSCLGRGQGLYGLANHESNLFTRIMPDVPLGGFFCNGEIGQIGGSTYVHGYTSCFGILSN